MSDQRPKPLGITYSGNGVSDEVAQVVQGKISKAANLTDLCEEYEFYTPALIHIGVELLNHDPYADFLNEQGGNVHRISLRFNRQVFAGMGLGTNYEWNHVLYGIEKGKWPALKEFMGQIAFHDRDAKVVTRIRTQDLEIVDPLYFDRVALLPVVYPRVQITAFVLDASNGCFFLDTGWNRNPVMSPPMAQWTSRSYDDTQRFSETIIKDGVDPYDGIGEDPQSELERRVKKAREQND